MCEVVSPRRTVREGVLRCLYVTQTAVGAMTHYGIWILIAPYAEIRGAELVYRAVRHGNSSYERSWLRQEGFYDRRFSRRYMQYHTESPIRWSSQQTYDRLMQRSRDLSIAIHIASIVRYGRGLPAVPRQSLGERFRLVIPFVICTTRVTLPRLSRQFLITQAY